MRAARTKEQTVTYATARQNSMTSARDVKNGSATNVTHGARPNPMTRTVIDTMRETRCAPAKGLKTRLTCSVRVTGLAQVTVCSMEILMPGRPSRGSSPFC